MACCNSSDEDGPQPQQPEQQEAVTAQPATVSNPSYTADVDTVDEPAATSDVAAATSSTTSQVAPTDASNTKEDHDEEEVTVVKTLTPEQLKEFFSEPPILLLGAGASIPNMPAAYHLKVEIVKNVLRVAHGGEDSEAFQEELKLVMDLLSSEVLTLEVLVSLIKFRGHHGFDTDHMWATICENCPPNELSQLTTWLLGTKKAFAILTSNFDRVLEDALVTKDLPFRCVTNYQLEEDDEITPEIGDVIPFHGTVFTSDKATYAGPFTATAAGLAKPLSTSMSSYVKSLLSGRRVVVAGYSGSDMYDLNPLIETMIADNLLDTSNWMWIVHGGNGKGVSPFVRRTFPNSLYGADTSGIFKQAFLEDFPESNYVSTQAKAPFQERLSTWFDGHMQISGEDAVSVVHDLQSNLTGAWIVSEHYRLVSMGFDERYSMYFAGIFDIADDTRAVRHHKHLDLVLTNGSRIPFGCILEAARVYRVEMNDTDQMFPATTQQMKEFLKHFDNAKILDDKVIRKEERAALHLGASIAWDYLGLISGRHVTGTLRKIKGLKKELSTADEVTKSGLEAQLVELEKKLADARASAASQFQACIDEGQTALDLSKENVALVKLIPAATWVQVGTENMGRFMQPGSDEAIHWLLKGIAGRKALIEAEMQEATEIQSGNATAALSTSKTTSLEAHYPQLWRRGGELVQQVLATQGFNVAPGLAYDDLTDERKELLAQGLEVSETAFSDHSKLVDRPSLNVPAVFDARVLVHLCKGEVEQAQTEVANIRALIDNLPAGSYAESRIAATKGWVNNIAARITDYESQKTSS